MNKQNEYDAKYPVNEFNKKIFSFTAGELREISSFDTIVKMGQLASVMVTNYINATSLKRVGIKSSPDVGLVYDIEKGEFYVYEPKFWCTMCNTRKGQFSYLEKAYCEGCFAILKKEAKKKKS